MYYIGTHVKVIFYIPKVVNNTYGMKTHRVTYFIGYEAGARTG